MTKCAMSNQMDRLHNDVGGSSAGHGGVRGNNEQNRDRDEHRANEHRANEHRANREASREKEFHHSSSRDGHHSSR